MTIRVKDTRFNNFYEFPDGTPPEQMEQAIGTIRQGLEAPRQPQPGGWAQSLAGVLHGATQQQPQTGSMLPSWGAKDVMGLTPDQVQQSAGMVMGDAKARRDAASQALESEKARAAEMKAMQMRLQNDQAERDMRERMGVEDRAQRQGMHESDIASRETLAEADRTAAMDRLNQQFKNQQTLQNERMQGQQTLASMRARGGSGGGGGGSNYFGATPTAAILDMFRKYPHIARAVSQDPNAPPLYRMIAAGEHPIPPESFPPPPEKREEWKDGVVYRSPDGQYLTLDPKEGIKVIEQPFGVGTPATQDAATFGREVFGTPSIEVISKQFDDDPGLAKAFLAAYPNAPMIYRQMAQRYVAEAGAAATQSAQSAAAEKSSKPGVFGRLGEWLNGQQSTGTALEQGVQSSGVGANAQLGSSRPDTNLLSPRAAKQYPNAEDVPAPPDKLEDWVMGQVYRSADNQFFMRDPVQGVIRVRPHDQEYSR